MINLFILIPEGFIGIYAWIEEWCMDALSDKLKKFDVTSPFSLGVGQTTSCHWWGCFPGGHQTFLCQPRYSQSPRRYWTRSNFFLLGTPIEFSLSNLYEILNLHNRGAYLYLSAYDKFPAFGESESKIYSLILVGGNKPNTATALKPIFVSFPSG